MRIELVGLAGLVGAAAAHRRPARVDLVDRLTERDELLGQAAAVTPGALDAPLAVTPEVSRPRSKLCQPDSLFGPSQSPSSLPASSMRAQHSCSCERRLRS